MVWLSRFFFFFIVLYMLDFGSKNSLQDVVCSLALQAKSVGDCRRLFKKKMVFSVRTWCIWQTFAFVKIELFKMYPAFRITL